MSAIKLNDLDPSFKFRIAQEPGGKGIMACYACRACTAACPIEPIERRYDPRKIIRMAILGMEKEVLTSEFIWFCSTCYACHEVCPQGVGFTELMFAIKNIAAKEACAPPGLTAQRNILIQHGRLYEIGEFENEKRTKLGLPPIEEHGEDFEKLLGK